MNYQDRYDELDNIVRTLDSLANEITDKYFLDVINQIKYEAQDELDEVEDKLYEEEQENEKELENEFNRGRL